MSPSGCASKSVQRAGCSAWSGPVEKSCPPARRYPSSGEQSRRLLLEQLGCAARRQPEGAKSGDQLTCGLRDSDLGATRPRRDRGRAHGVVYRWRRRQLRRQDGTSLSPGAASLRSDECSPRKARRHERQFELADRESAPTPALDKAIGPSNIVSFRKALNSVRVGRGRASCISGS